MERAFRDPDASMVPKYSGDPLSTMMQQEIYGDYLQSHYVQRAQSEFWVLLTRKQ